MSCLKLSKSVLKIDCLQWNCLSSEKNDVDDVELQNDHTDTLTTPSKTMVIPSLKTSSGKDILKWLDCEDRAPRCLEKHESVKMARESIQGVGWSTRN